MTPQPRPLTRVIDALCKVAPELTEHFKWLRNHICYTPPENQGQNWHQVMAILVEHASEHPEQETLRRVFADEIPLDQILGPEEEPEEDTSEVYQKAQGTNPDLEKDMLKAFLYEIVEVALHSGLPAPHKVGWMGNLAQKALGIQPLDEDRVPRYGSKVFICSNLEDTLTKLGFVGDIPQVMHKRFAGTVQHVQAVWTDEDSKVDYVTVDLCCEIPVACCLVVR